MSAQGGWAKVARAPRLTVGALVLVRRAAPRQLLVTVALQVVVAVLIGVQLLIARELIAHIVNERLSTARLAVPFLVLIVATAASGFATALIAQQQRLLSEVVSYRTMSGIISAASAVPFANYEDPEFYDRLERARNAGTFRPIEIVTSVVALLTSTLTSIGVAVALLTIQPALVLLLIVAGLPLLAASLQNSRQSYEFDRTLTIETRERLHLMELLTSRSAAKELRLFGAAPFLTDRHDLLTASRLRMLRGFLRARLKVSLIGVVGTALGSAIALGSLVWFLSTGRIGAAGAITAALAMQVLASRLSAVTTALSKIVESGLFLDDYREFLEEAHTPTTAGPSDPVELPPVFGGLDVDGLSFTYPRSARAALEDVSIIVRPGEVVALVGENGSGKTTLVKLIAQLYRGGYDGNIRWSGVDVERLRAADVQSQIAVLFQDFVQYQLTLSENIALGRATDGVRPDEIREAAAKAGADGLAAALPNGYESRLGFQFYGGQELSGGQWQRIALARAFYRDADFLILDEPTAALDPRAEAELFERVRALAAGRSVLLISHRFSSVRTADRIYVLDGGRVVEAGTHEELVDADGLYAELFALQADAYLGETT